MADERPMLGAARRRRAAAPGRVPAQRRLRGAAARPQGAGAERRHPDGHRLQAEGPGRGRFLYRTQVELLAERRRTFPSPSTSPATPTRWSRAASKTASSWSAIRTCSSRAWSWAPTRSSRHRLHVHPRRVLRSRGRYAGGDRRGLRGQLPRRSHHGHGLQPGAARAHERRPLHVRRGLRHAQRPGGQAGTAAHPPAAQASAACGASPRSSTTSRASAACRTSCAAAAAWLMSLAAPTRAAPRSTASAAR